MEKSFAESLALVLEKTAVVDYQMKVDSGSNLIRLKRRFTEADEVFAERFAADLNKHFNYCIGGEMTKLIKRFDFYINCQFNAIESKAANIDY